MVFWGIDGFKQAVIGFVVQQACADFTRWRAAGDNAVKQNVFAFVPDQGKQALEIPDEQWQRLSSHGRRISRYIAAAKGETVIGAGYLHPKAKMRDAFKAAQLAQLDPEVADEWLLRH